MRNIKFKTKPKLLNVALVAAGLLTMMNNANANDVGIENIMPELEQPPYESQPLIPPRTQTGLVDPAGAGSNQPGNTNSGTTSTTSAMTVNVVQGKNIVVTNSTSNNEKTFVVSLDDSVTTAITNAQNTANQARTAANRAQTTANTANTKVDELKNLAVVYDNANKNTVTLSGTSGVKVTNIAPAQLSATSKDAVNGAQLFTTNQQVEANKAAIADINRRLNATPVGSVATSPASNVTVVQGDDIVVTSTTQNGDKTFTVGLSGGVKTSITKAQQTANVAQTTADTALTKATNLENNAVVYTGTDKSTVNLSGANGTKITNLTAGQLSATSKDAVNGAQLFAVTQAIESLKNQQGSTAGAATPAKLVGTADVSVATTTTGGVTTHTIGISDAIKAQIAKEESVSAGSNIVVTQDKLNATGGKNFEVSLKGDLTNINSITNNGKPISFGGAILTGVGAGAVATGSTDAINGDQLFSVLQQANNNTQAVKKVDDAIAGVKATGVQNKADIESLKPQVLQNTAGVTANAADIAATRTELGNLKPQVAKNTDGITANKAEIENLKPRVAKNESGIAQNTAEIEKLKPQVAKNTADITANKVEIDNLKPRVAKNETDIAQNTADIEKLKPQVAKNTADIAANRADIENLKPRVAKNEADIAQNTADIEANRANIAKGLNFKTQDGVTTNKQLGDTVTVLGDSKNISTQTVGGNIIVKMTDDARLQTLTLGKDAEISATSKQAVNASQLHATNMHVTNNSQAIQTVDAKVEKGLTLRSDDGKTTNYKLGDTINVAGDGVNTISKTVDGKTVFSLNQNIVVESARFGNNGVVINQNGINAGDKVINNVASGDISATSKHAVNGMQLHAAYNHFNDGLTGLKQHVDGVEDNLEAGLAGTNAAAALPQVNMFGKSMLAVAGGGYADKSAVAVGFSRLSDNGRVLFKSHINANTEKKLGYGVGVGFTW